MSSCKIKQKIKTTTNVCSLIPGWNTSLFPVINTTDKSNLGKKFVWLTHSGHSPSLRETRAETQIVTWRQALKQKAERTAY